MPALVPSPSFRLAITVFLVAPAVRAAQPTATPAHASPPTNGVVGARTASAAPDRLDPFPGLFSELRLSPEKIRRLRELLRVPEATALEVEAEISRGAYRSRQDALEVFTLACTEAETEIQKLLPPLAYARFTTVRDEVPARRLLDAYDRALTSAAPASTSPAATSGLETPPPASPIDSATLFPAETFDRLAAAITVICRRHGITPSATPPPGASRTDDFVPYLAAREAAETEIARALAPSLTEPQRSALAQFQAEQRATLAALWRQAPVRSWAQRR